MADYSGWIGTGFSNMPWLITDGSTLPTNIRDAILNYTSGHQNNNFPWNISNIGNVTQQGGGGNSSSTQQGGSGGGGNSTSQGVSTVNGGQNFQERLNYFNQAMAEQAETNLEGFFALFFTDGPMKSILENGKNSPYLSELDEEDAEKIAEVVRGTYKIVRDTLYMKNSTAVTQEDYLQFLSGIGQFLNDNASFLSTLNDLLGKYNTPVTDSLWKVHPILAIGGAISGALMSVLAANWAINDFNQRYPYAREDAWREVVGGTPTLLDKLNFSNRREVNGILKNIDPDRYDKTNLNFISSIANDLKMGVGVVVGGILIIGAGVLAAPEIVLVTGLGLLITGGISLVEAGFKADYLQKVHGHEQNDWQTVTEQLFGQDYGAFKNWFKGNENPSSSPDVAEPTSNTSPKNLLMTANPLIIDVTDSAVIYDVSNNSAATTKSAMSAIVLR